MKCFKIKNLINVCTVLMVLFLTTTVVFAYVTNGVSDSSANVYSTSSGSTVIGSIGPDENLHLGSVADGRTYITYLTSNGEKSGWVSSGAVLSTDWRWPLECVRKTLTFNEYYSGKGGYHLGCDMTSLIYNDGIRATWDGKVKYKGYSSGNGNHVIVETMNNDGVKLYILYSHLASIDPDMVAGYEFSKGAHIGEMGATGSVSGKHLHFSIMNKYYSSDPYGYTSSGGTVVSRNSEKIVMSYSGNQVTYYSPSYVIKHGGAIPN